MARLNRGLLALRLGLYAALVGTLLASAPIRSAPLAALVALLAVVPALPARWLARHRIESGIAISLGLEAWMWTWLGSVPALELLPVFSVLVAGLLLSRRTAIAVTTTAVGIQLAQLALWWSGLIGVDNSASGLIGEVALVAVAGVGFLEIGAVLREYRARVVEQSLEEIRLTELIDEKDRLIDSVAHELRTPLTAVLGLSSELASGSFAAEESSAPTAPGTDVFERYRSGGDANRPDNLGLCLPVARTLARHMGGDLEVVDGWVTLTLPATTRAEVRV